MSVHREAGVGGQLPGGSAPRGGGAWSGGCMVLGGAWSLGCVHGPGGGYGGVRGWWGCMAPGGCMVPGWGCPVETPPTATAAGGTHPTGMHSCLTKVFQIENVE